MKPEEALSIMQLNQPLATLAHAAAFLAVCVDRGLTPFLEIYPIFTEKKEKIGDQWRVTGLKGMTFKEHYSVQNRWSQKSGGYSTPFRKTEQVTRTNDYGKKEDGIEATVGIITNRDYAALAMMAQARIPGWDYETEREAFVHYATAFCPNSHKPPSGWTIAGVARKRAEEQALKLAFGKEPSQSRQMYGNILAAEATETVSALYGPAPQEALPAPAIVNASPAKTAEVIINGEYTEPRADLDYGGELIDEGQLTADIARAAEVVAEQAVIPADFDDTPFASPTAATAWAIAQGAFGKPDGGTAKHARAAWDKVTTGADCPSAAAASWRADVARRLAEKEAQA